MVDKGANINEASAKGETPLSRNLANATAETYAQDGAVFRLLMERGVDVTPAQGREHPIVAVSKVRGGSQPGKRLGSMALRAWQGH